MTDTDARVQAVLEQAQQARDRAYVPYSRFRMGAALLTAQGTVVQGCLVENVSLGLAMCAERVALFSAVAQAAGRPEVLALVSARTDGRLTWPCGACLQVAMEFGGPDMLVVASDGREVSTARLAELAPQLPFKS